ncbi:Putative WD repeat-containing protein (AFU_orthologue; AFUA_1G02990) [Aspergillus calidoustus]|uniref:Putative WD repeat-containing protein (AFU_orthologue AFUA_1G02990) n=1 Tax=Aspergillus calidoustus TaxID=454130 RepID=A0A0U5G3C6_ASPCI|nr:Putative WD repeat-containing protein (AFU_orthologue; AFUA_1G02990) [Aspergillus calidoustus]
MTRSLYDRIWRREAGGFSTAANIRGLYGSKEWVGDLDIVNELGGHTGCVNALSWSRSGRLLASGSDDFHLNIYSYQPESSTTPFALNTSVFTGHTGNIFSVAFMPHSNDRTLVTAAGDSQVRVFDIEHSSRNSSQSAPLPFSSQARSQSLNQFFGNARSLGVGNTNARIYRSHADRVKRIVTESSPHLFLTCSEDGEVRQWDLRMPSSAYPKPRGGLLYMTNRAGQGHDDTNVPPPLISYKRHRLDLNTLHCFLHDRRMLGRDISVERGDPGASPVSRDGHDDELMGKATRCVRRFAPNGKERTKSRYKGHITACKISNANPNEMIVSWSGDHIYSFDLIRAPDALDAPENQTSLRGKSGSRKRRTSKARKRKRQNATSLSSQSSGDGRRRSRRNEAAASQEEDGNLALRVRYGNGETENISFPELLHEAGSTASGAATSAELMERARYSVLNGAQRQSLRIAKGLVKLRKAMFSLEPAVREAGAAMPFRDAFSSVLMVASTFLPQMEQVMRTWGYPINPTPEVVRFQQTLRRHRESAYRFVQATGTLARALGGDIQDFGIDDALEKFERIGPAPGEDNVIVEKEQFGYDFLKAIILFTEGGRSAVLSGFKGSSASRRNRDRFPLPQNALDGAIETILVPYLSDLAGDAPVVNVDSSRFEYDSTRILFPTQRAAVAAFGEALKVDMSSGSDGRHNDGPNGAANGNSNGTPNGTNPRATDPSTLTRFWLLEVGRGILMEVGTGVNFEYVNRAFGGLNATIEDSPDDDGDMEIERSQDDSEANIEEAAIHDISFTFNRDPSHQRHPAFMESWTPNLSTQTASEDGDYNGAPVMNSGATDETDDTDDTEDDEGAEDDDDDDDDDSSDSDAAERLFRSYGFERSAREDEVEKDVPCSSHTRVYRGHCNVKTVKDCNFFGLNDEYVVSGSDSGHLFIWERDTCKLVNILKGDDEVVNVVQGHPYEPIIAASGIDDTIKIFSPDQRAQDDARRGINILDPNNPANTLGPSAGGLKSAKCMHDSYRIMSENDVQRQGGMSDAFVTRHMLAQFAATVRDQQGGVVPGEHARIVLDENCNVSLSPSLLFSFAIFIPCFAL